MGTPAGLPALYLGYCLVRKAKDDSDFRKILKEQHISYTRYFNTTAHSGTGSGMRWREWLWVLYSFPFLIRQQHKIEFHYLPEHPSGNNLVVQPGRFQDWNWQVFTTLLKRIRVN